MPSEHDCFPEPVGEVRGRARGRHRRPGLGCAEGRERARRAGLTLMVRPRDLLLGLGVHLPQLVVVAAAEDGDGREGQSQGAHVSVALSLGLPKILRRVSHHVRFTYACQIHTFNIPNKRTRILALLSIVKNDK